MNNYTEYGYRGLEEVKSLQSEVEMLRKQLAEENKEKYALMKRVKELQQEVDELKSQIGAIVR